MNEDYDWYDEDMEHLSKAMLRAKEAFENYFKEQGLDGAYWTLNLTGYTLTTGDFKPLDKIEMKFDPINENGGEEE